jgi:predicted 2-oxoglutarate/Fe(II)-dependent dioxygenase YbiX
MIENTAENDNFLTEDLTIPDLNNLEYEEIIPKVFLYKNLFPATKTFNAVLNESQLKPEKSFLFKNWEQWSRFGSYVVKWTFSPKDEFNQTPKYLKEKFFIEATNQIFQATTKHYLSHHNVEVKEDWTIMGPSFCKYETSGVQEKHLEDNGLVMAYHTDYVGYDDAQPDFALTCTMYINDNYEGGDVAFKVGKDDYVYKPQAGDVMVFPSGHPDLLSEENVCVHGVKKITSGIKYFIRIFYQIPNEAMKRELTERGQDE